MRVRPRFILLSLLAVMVVLGVVVISMVGWQVVLGPKARPLTGRTFERTAARAARGEYLTTVAACFHCHSEHDMTRAELPTIEGRKGAGWTLPIPELGSVVAPNITPDPETGIGSWTDDEIARAIQEGVSRDGRALFPIMPYMNFRNLDDEDLASIVVYLRTLTPVRNAVPETKLVFPLNVLVKTMPQPLESRPPSVPRTTPETRGEYLVRTVIGCQDCHSPADDRGQFLAGLDLAGGGIFHDPVKGDVASRNITPDPSGIAHYDEALFKEVLRTGRMKGTVLSHVMPFEGFRQLTDGDLADMFSYLRSVPAVQHRVSNTDPPDKCAICGQTHGLGELNVKP